ncbi:MAG: glycosyltransferase family 39 protein, partial [Dehalococcoidia bacterium]|nr:glycosyltransferase family 39 protein [Dehalococcoidia bacterium]
MLSWVDTAAKGFRPVGIIALLSFVPQAFIAAINLVPEYDESIYLDISENLYRMGLPIVSYESGIFFFQHPPLSFLFFSLPFVANLDYLVAYRAVSSVFAVGTVFLTFLLGRLVGGRRIAILAAALLAFTPLFLAYSHSVYMDVILGFFLLLSAYFFLKADEQGKGVFWLLSGISLGLALWVKYLAAIAVLAYLAHLFMRYRWSVARRRETYVLLGPALGLFLLWPVYGLALDHQQFISELVRWSTFGGNNLHDARVGVSLPEYGLRFLRSISPPIVVLLVFAMVRKLLVAGRRPAKLQTFFPHWYLVIWILFLALVMPIKDMRYLIPAIPWIGLAVA